MKKKINVFDLIVIILVVLLIVAVAGFFGLKAIKKANGQADLAYEVTYQIKIESVREETVNSFEAGDYVFSNTNSEKIGVITQIETEDAKEDMETLDGRIISAPVEGKYDMLLTIRGVVRKKEAGDTWIGTEDRILEGLSLTFQTQKNKCQGMVKNIEIKDSYGEVTGSFKNFKESYYQKGE